MNLNALHRRLMQDVLEIGNSLPLVITGGYAVQAHQLVDRLSRDIDVATGSNIPMEDIAATVVAGLTARHWDTCIIGVDSRSAQLCSNIELESLGRGPRKIAAGSSAKALIGKARLRGLTLRSVAIEFLSDDQVAAYGRFVGPAERAELVGKRRGDHNRLGFSLQLGTVRFVGLFLEEVLARLLQAADAGGHHIDVQLADGGTLRVGQRGLDDGVRISHAPTGAEWEFDTVTTQQLITALLSTAHS